MRVHKRAPPDSLRRYLRAFRIRKLMQCFAAEMHILDVLLTTYFSEPKLLCACVCFLYVIYYLVRRIVLPARSDICNTYIYT